MELNLVPSLACSALPAAAALSSLTPLEATIICTFDYCASLIVLHDDKGPKLTSFTFHVVQLSCLDVDMSITIPSPSAFLRSPVLQPTAPSINSKPASKRQVASSKTYKSSTIGTDGVTKPKQSKSRNGIVEAAPGLLAPISRVDSGANIWDRLRYMQGEKAEMRRDQTIVSAVS